MANTLYRAGDALPVFRTERVTGKNQELVYDAAGRAHYIIDRNEVVYSLSDNRMAYWMSGNYLIGPGERPAYYLTSHARMNWFRLLGSGHPTTKC